MQYKVYYKAKGVRVRVCVVGLVTTVKQFETANSGNDQELFTTTRSCAYIHMHMQIANKQQTINHPTTIPSFYLSSYSRYCFFAPLLCTNHPTFHFAGKATGITGTTLESARTKLLLMWRVQQPIICGHYLIFNIHQSFIDVRTPLLQPFVHLGDLGVV